MKTVALIIPVYNEENRLVNTFNALTSVQVPRGIKLSQVIFVNDGSQDKSKKTIQSQIARLKNKPFSISLVSYRDNRGKGYAIREGLRASRADYSLFMDSDMSTPLSELSKFVKPINQSVDLVIGTRKNGHSTVIKHQPFVREFLGKCFTRLTKIVLGIYGTDFTCGFKALSKQAREVYLLNGKINRWGYDVELIYLSQKHSLSQTEVAVVWSNDPRTKVRLGNDIASTLRELILIRFHSRNGGYASFATSPVTHVK
jgi:dolichyl-phosphate beta-glucosyltransferase